MIATLIKDFNKEASSKNFLRKMAEFFVYQTIDRMFSKISSPLRKINEVKLKNITFGSFDSINLELELNPIGLTGKCSFYYFSFEDTEYKLTRESRGEKKRVLVKDQEGFIQTSFTLETFRPFVEEVISEVNEEI